MANVNCDAVNDLVFGFLKSSRPQIVLLHAMWDRSHNLDRLGETIRQLKAINIPRIVIQGPVPLWKRTLPLALADTYRFRHVIADRVASGVSGAGSDEQMQAFSRAAGVEYISAWRALCDGEGCLTRVGPTADDVVTTDIVHLSDAGSKFPVETIEGSLFLPQGVFSRANSSGGLAAPAPIRLADVFLAGSNRAAARAWSVAGGPKK